MSSELQTLVEDASAMIGAAPPALLDANAPIFQPNESPAIYLVGLIGGKEVGKSSLINALVGESISEQTDSGPGTEQAIAYAHHSASAELKRLLDFIVPNQYRIVPHNV
ncbi:MAG: 50S ribosome-binding GTPase, partial [Phycisphaerae bacterium]|nr:50S ribosome-binding GTPase [Phycisphaerae bacterium]